MTALVNDRLLAEVFVTLVVIMDPLGTLPVFLALTATADRRSRIVAARQAVAVALVVIVLFAFFGQAILRYLHVTLSALQCAGGLLLLLIALQLLTDRSDTQPVTTEGVNIAFVPLEHRCWPVPARSSRRWCSSTGCTAGPTPSLWRSACSASTSCCT